MKQIIKGAVLGGIIGIAAPIALSVINEFEWSQRSSGTKQARICFANRLWNLETFQVKHAPGCKNGILENTPTILLISVLSGSLIGALSLIKSNTQADERESKTPSITPIESPNKDPLPSQEIANVPLREAKTPSPITQSSSPATESIPSPSNLQEKTPTISVGTNDSQSRQIPKGMTIPSVSLPVALGLLLAGVGVIAAYQSGSNNNASQPNSGTALQSGFQITGDDGYKWLFDKEGVTCTTEETPAKTTDPDEEDGWYSKTGAHVSVMCRGYGYNEDQTGKKEHYSTADVLCQRTGFDYWASWSPAEGIGPPSLDGHPKTKTPVSNYVEPETSNHVICQAGRHYNMF